MINKHLRDLKQETSLFVSILVLRAVEILCMVEFEHEKRFITSGYYEDKATCEYDVFTGLTCNTASHIVLKYTNNLFL